jgi:hypothetical protein
VIAVEGNKLRRLFYKVQQVLIGESVISVTNIFIQHMDDNKFKLMMNINELSLLKLSSHLRKMNTLRLTPYWLNRLVKVA